MSKDEEDEEPGNIGVGRYPCMPSLVALQQMRNRLHLAHLGKKLMKWSALATGRELRKIAVHLNDTIGDLTDDLSTAYMLLARARYYNPNLNQMVLEHVNKQASVTLVTTTKTVSAGVRVLQFEISANEKDPYLHLGIEKGGQSIKEAKLAWYDLLRRMILILELRESFSSVEDAHKSATKKQNVLAKVIIPRITTTLRYILSELEEKEREETFRLKRFKQLKTKTNSVVAKICACCSQWFRALQEPSDPTCPICASTFKTRTANVTLKFQPCENIGEELLKYLDDHMYEIKELANNFPVKPCCLIDDGLKCLPPSYKPIPPITEELDVSFMDKVQPLPVDTEEPLKDKDLDLPSDMEELDIMCLKDEALCVCSEQKPKLVWKPREWPDDIHRLIPPKDLKKGFSAPPTPQEDSKLLPLPCASAPCVCEFSPTENNLDVTPLLTKAVQKLNEICPSCISNLPVQSFEIVSSHKNMAVETSDLSFCEIHKHMLKPCKICYKLRNQYSYETFLKSIKSSSKASAAYKTSNGANPSNDFSDLDMSNKSSENTICSYISCSNRGTGGKNTVKKLRQISKGYSEKVVKTIKIKRIRNDDGSVSEEKRVIIKTVRRPPPKDQPRNEGPPNEETRDKPSSNGSSQDKSSNMETTNNDVLFDSNPCGDTEKDCHSEEKNMKPPNDFKHHYQNASTSTGDCSFSANVNNPIYTNKWKSKSEQNKAFEQMYDPELRSCISDVPAKENGKYLDPNSENSCMSALKMSFKSKAVNTAMNNLILREPGIPQHVNSSSQYENDAYSICYEDTFVGMNPSSIRHPKQNDRSTEVIFTDEFLGPENENKVKVIKTFTKFSNANTTSKLTGTDTSCHANSKTNNTNELNVSKNISPINSEHSSSSQKGNIIFENLIESELESVAPVIIKINNNNNKKHVATATNNMPDSKELTLPKEKSSSKPNCRKNSKNDECNNTDEKSTSTKFNRKTDSINNNSSKHSTKVKITEDNAQLHKTKTGVNDTNNETLETKDVTKDESNLDIKTSKTSKPDDQSSSGQTQSCCLLQIKSKYTMSNGTTHQNKLEMKSKSANNVKTRNGICKNCLFKLSGFIPSRSDSSVRETLQCRMCQMKSSSNTKNDRKENSNHRKIIDTDSLSYESYSMASLSHICIDLAASYTSLKADADALRNDLPTAKSTPHNTKEDQTSIFASSNRDTISTYSTCSEGTCETVKNDEQKKKRCTDSYKFLNNTTLLIEKIEDELRIDSLLSEIEQSSSNKTKKCKKSLRSKKNDIKYPVCYATNVNKNFTINKINSDEEINKSIGHSISNTSLSRENSSYKRDMSGPSSKFKDKPTRKLFITDSLAEICEQYFIPTEETTDTIQNAECAVFTPISGSSIMEHSVKFNNHERVFKFNDGADCCNNHSSNTTYKKDIPKFGEPCLYRRVRANDSSVFRKNEDNEKCIEKKTVDRCKCCNKTPFCCPIEELNPKVEGITKKVSCKSSLCTHKTCVISPKSSRSYADQSTFTHLCTNAADKIRSAYEEILNQITGVTNMGARAVRSGSCVSAPHITVKGCLKSSNISCPQFNNNIAHTQDACTNTKKSSRYDVRCLSHFPKPSQKISNASVSSNRTINANSRNLNGSISCHTIDCIGKRKYAIKRGSSYHHYCTR